MKRKKTTRKRSKSPAEQAKSPPVSPINGQPIPVANQWKPGQSGNPAGRPSALATMQDWFNIMCEWTEGDLEAVFTDPAATIAKKSAAGRWLDAGSRRTTIGGNPIAGAELDRIMDRTGGKPTQSVNVKADVNSTNAANVHNTMDKAAGDPEMRAALKVLADKLDVDAS